MEQSRCAEKAVPTKTEPALPNRGFSTRTAPAEGRERGQQWFCFSQLCLRPFGFAVVGFSVLLLVQQPPGSCFLVRVWEPVPFTQNKENLWEF